MNIVVAKNTLAWRDRRVRCAVGRGGLARAKREGDGATPIGRFPLRSVLYRPDRLPPPATALASRAIGVDDGWCDDPNDPAYNRPVALPYPARHERLWRRDRLYDLVVPLGYNDDPVVPGLGSAVFLHVAAPDFAATEGCVAISVADLLALIAEAGPSDTLAVEGV